MAFGGGESVQHSRASDGKYLSNEIYVEVEQGAATETSRGRVEVEILPTVAIEADSGADAQTCVCGDEKTQD